MRTGIGLSTLLLLGAMIVAPALASPADDVAAVTRHLRQTHPGSHWQAGPTLVSSAEVVAAYQGARRFYAVESSPPIGPGANLKELVERYQKAMREYNSHHYITAVVSIDAPGHVSDVGHAIDFNVSLQDHRDLGNATDYNAGLLAAHGQAELKRNAAALFTVQLATYWCGPRPVTAGEVSLQPAANGWVASIQRCNQSLQIALDAAGHLNAPLFLPSAPMPPQAPRSLSPAR